MGTPGSESGLEKRADGNIGTALQADSTGHTSPRWQCPVRQLPHRQQNLMRCPFVSAVEVKTPMFPRFRIYRSQSFSTADAFKICL